MSNIDKTLAERGSRYGEFPEHAAITQGIKDAMQLGRNWIELPDDMKEALDMVAHKVGRILNGDPSYIDSWTDIIGYTRLVEKRLITEQQTAKVFAFPDIKPPTGATEGDKAAEMAAHAAAKTQSTAAKPEQCNCLGCMLERTLGSKLRA